MITGPLIVWLGQRKVLLCAIPLFMASWLAHAFAPYVWLLQLSRATLGLCLGVYSFSIFTYTVEITHPKYRSISCGFIDCLRQTGMLFIYAVGSSRLHWRSVALVCAFSSTIVPFCLFLFLPDSPRWLALHNRNKEAKKALVFYRGKNFDTDSELNHITIQLQETKGSDSALTQFKMIINDKSILKRVLIIILILSISQFTGNIIIVSYTTIVFQSLPTSLNEYHSSIMIAVIRFIAVFCYTVSSAKLGRKKLAVIPVFICGIMLISTGSISYLSKQGYDLENIGWLPLIMMVVFVFFVCFNVSVLNIYRNELLPNSVRPVAGACISPIALVSFVVLYFFPTVKNLIGIHGLFWAFGINCICMSILSYFLLPETKGKSLEEIDDFFRGRR